MGIESGERWRRKSDGLEVVTSFGPGEVLRVEEVGDHSPKWGSDIEEDLLRADYEPVNTSDEPEAPIYDRESLPDDFQAPGGHSWADFELIAPLRALKIDGPFQVRLPLDHALRDDIGAVTCRDGWLAIDHRGEPFPINEDDFKELYAPMAGSAGVAMKPDEAIAAAVEKRFGAWLDIEDIKMLRALADGDVKPEALQELGTLDKLDRILQGAS